MGSLSNLYISQSYQSLIHLGTNNTASATLIGLEDGLGNSIGVSVNTAGNLFLSGTFSASLQEGYLYVGNASGRTIAFPTSSLVTNINTGSLLTTSSFNAYTASTNIRLSNIELTTASVLISISNLNASSASQQISIDALNAFTASQSTASIVSSITQLNQFTQSANIRLNNLESTSASVNISLSNINAYTQSNDAKWQDLGNKSGSWITESETGSFARYDVSNPWSADQNFTNITAFSASFQYVKTVFETASVIYSSGSNQLGDELTDVQTLSGSVLVRGGLFVNDIDVTSSLNSINVFTQSANIRLNNLETTSASVNISISNLNTFTASISTASIVNSITNLNQFTQSANQRLGSLEAATSSYAISSSVAAVDAAQQAQINSLIQATSSYADSASFAASQLVQDNRLNNLEAATSSYATDIELAAATGALENSIATKLDTSSFNQFTQSYYQDSASFDLRIDNLEAFSSSLDITYVTQTELAAATGALENSIATKLDTSSFNAYTSSTNARLSNIELTTASLLIETQNLELFTSSQALLNTTFATTGSNNFRGAQRIINPSNVGSENNGVILTAHSGSLILTNNAFTTGSYGYISASNAGQTNIIMQQNNAAADFILSGSFNIISLPAAPTAGFKRFMGISNIALSGGNIPQISGSMAYPITMNNNILTSNGTTINMRGPVSSSAWTINANFLGGTVNIGTAAATHAQSLVAGASIFQNVIPGTLNVIAANPGINFNSPATIAANYIAGGATLSMTGSVIQFNNNIVNDAGTSIVNGWYSSSVGLGALAVNRNNFAGQSQTMFVSGAMPAGSTFNAPSYSDNAMFGGENTIFTNVSAAPITGSRTLHSAIRTIIGGHQLIVTGSSNLLLTDTFGSAFFGRWNANDGVRNRSGQNVFVVGTGKNNTERKTGFLIDSGSNAYFEGNHFISGSTTLSGSLYIQSGSTLPNQTGSAILTWNPTTGQVAQASFAQVNSASLSLGGFQDTTTQSGSADVAYAFNFNTIDFQDGIILSGSTGLQITKKGTYDLQWSGQLVQGASSGDVTVWLRKNGTNIDGTAGRVTMASNTKLLPAWNYLLDLNVNDVIELMWASTSANSTWEYIPAATIYPAAASIIVTLAQQR